jgi:hypothetical protein
MKISLILNYVFQSVNYLDFSRALCRLGYLVHYKIDLISPSFRYVRIFN